MNRENPQGVESRYGWVIVAAAAVLLGMGTGSLNTISVTLKPIIAEMGWLRGETAFAYMAGATSTGVFGILMGYLSDRFSVRSIVLLGAVALGGALLLLSRLTALWEFLPLLLPARRARVRRPFRPVDRPCGQMV